jgi:hypothetical protein
MNSGLPTARSLPSETGCWGRVRIGGDDVRSHAEAARNVRDDVHGVAGDIRKDAEDGRTGGGGVPSHEENVRDSHNETTESFRKEIDYMAGDYIPRSDLDLSTWAGTFIDHLEDCAAELGISPATIQTLRAGQQSFDTSHGEFLAAQTAAAAAFESKDGARKELISNLRSVSQQVQANPAATDVHRSALGITIKGRRKRAYIDSVEGAPAPTIDTGSHLRHVMRIQNRTSDGVTGVRPAGVIGCELWRTFGQPPAEDKELLFAGLATRTRFVVEYDAEDAGKSVYYMLRWIDSRGDTGDWSPTYVATVAA